MVLNACSDSTWYLLISESLLIHTEAAGLCHQPAWTQYQTLLLSARSWCARQERGAHVHLDEKSSIPTSFCLERLTAWNPTKDCRAGSKRVEVSKSRFLNQRLRCLKTNRLVKYRLRGSFPEASQNPSAFNISGCTLAPNSQVPGFRSPGLEPNPSWHFNALRSRRRLLLWKELGIKVGKA